MVQLPVMLVVFNVDVLTILKQYFGQLTHIMCVRQYQSEYTKQAAIHTHLMHACIHVCFVTNCVVHSHRISIFYVWMFYFPRIYIFLLRILFIFISVHFARQYIVHFHYDIYRFRSQTASDSHSRCLSVIDQLHRNDIQ